MQNTIITCKVTIIKLLIYLSMMNQLGLIIMPHMRICIYININKILQLPFN